MDEPTLHCPQCDYNLTGLTENRCPECGNRFDRQLLTLSNRIRPLKIGWVEAALRLLAFPVIMPLAVGFAHRLEIDWCAFTTILPFGAFLIGSGVQSARITQRVLGPIGYMDPGWDDHWHLLFKAFSFWLLFEAFQVFVGVVAAFLLANFLM